MKVTSYSSFAALPDDARTIGQHYRDVNPFVCDLWLQRYEEFLLGKNDQALYLLVSEQDECVAVFPLILTKLNRIPVWKVHSMANFYTTVFEPLLAATADILKVAEVIAGYFWRELKKYPLIEIEPVRHSVILDQIALHYGELSGQLVRRYAKHSNRFETVDGDNFDSYLARRPGKLRSTIKRKRNQLEKKTQSSIDIHSTSADIARTFPQFRAIYAESWKGEESSPDFICAVLGDLADVGKAKLGILSINGEPAAAQIWFKIGTGWGVFKLAYRPQFSNYSVGTLLTASMIEGFFADGGVSEIDFFSGDDAYKQDWVASCREHSGFEFVQSGNVLGKVLNLKRKIHGT